MADETTTIAPATPIPFRDTVGVDELIETIDRNMRRIDRSVSIGLGLIAGGIFALSVARTR